MKSKRKKVLIILGLVVVAAMCVVTLWPRDEPKYKGRYLSDWMALHLEAFYDPDRAQQLANAQQAVRAIGTNAVPYFLKWMRAETPRWKLTVLQKFPDWIAANPIVHPWLAAEQIRSGYGLTGFSILGSNAIGAIPELRTMVKDPDQTISLSASTALANIGEPAIPVLLEALADTNQLKRWKFVAAISRIASQGHTNTCLPLIVHALNDHDPSVRDTATNALLSLAPHLLTNGAAK